ncbi:MAG: hypothetical protein ACRD2X_19765 [Vicinamibacteraceae bacterium]
MKFRGILALLGLLVVAGALVAYVAPDRAEDRPQAPQGQASPRSGEATEPDCGAEAAQDGSSSEPPPQQGAKSETERASNEAKPAGPSADDPLGGMAPCDPQ